jgi:hypothetical protein
MVTNLFFRKLAELTDEAFTNLNDSLFALLAVKPTIYSPYYKVHIHDYNNRNIKTYEFNSLTDAMNWVSDRNLLYETEKKVFLEHVKENDNSLIELNIISNNVFQKRPTVYRSQEQN